jgi:hypothetical protein
MEILVGLIAGAVIVWMAPGIAGRVLRPAAKGMIKGSVVAYKAASEAVSEARESVGDMVAEAKSEMHEPQMHHDGGVSTNHKSADEPRAERTVTRARVR